MLLSNKNMNGKKKKKKTEWKMENPSHADKPCT